MKPTPGRPVAVIALLLASMPLIAEAQQPYFPDLVFSPDNKELNDFKDRMKSRQLKALKEPSLWKRSQVDRSTSIYRFLWLGSNEHPACVRITKTGGVASMHVSRHDQSPGIITDEDKPKLIVDREVKLSMRQWDGFVGQVEAAKFWAAPTETVKNSGIADGDMLVIEGMKDGKYHVVVRHRLIAKNDYEPLFRSVLETAGPDIAESWDDFHKRSYVREFFEKNSKK